MNYLPKLALNHDLCLLNIYFYYFNTCIFKYLLVLKYQKRYYHKQTAEVPLTHVVFWRISSMFPCSRSLGTIWQLVECTTPDSARIAFPRVGQALTLCGRPAGDLEMYCILQSLPSKWENPLYIMHFQFYICRNVLLRECVKMPLYVLDNCHDPFSFPAH
jgi:hypothetical protein